MRSGYAGFILRVDLSREEFCQEPLDEKIARDFIGGFGINNKLAYDLISPGTEPLSPENPIILGAGLLSGTLAPASSRVFATTKFPIAGAIGSACGGGFGFMLKAAGYDHLIITGQAKGPRTLKITENSLEFLPAEDLWGKDIFQTTEELWKRYGDEAQVIAIGPAGEKLVSFSFCLLNNLSTLGRGGLGAVMGAKNLKAIVVRGNKGVPVHEAKAFEETSDAVYETMVGLPYRENWLKYGPTVARFQGGRKGYEYDNYRQWKLDEELELAYGPEAYQELWRGTRACPSCPVGCKAVLQGEGTLTPFSSALAAAERWGARFNLGSLKAAIKFRDFCNRQGIDDYMVTSLIDFAIDLFQAGLISERETGGKPLERSGLTAAFLLKAIAEREGIGDLLAQGFLPVIARLGKEAERLAVHIKGLDPYRDPREILDGIAISQAVNPRGSYGVPGNSPAYLPGRSREQFQRYLKRLQVSAEAIERICGRATVNMARLTRYAEDWYSLLSCLGVCVRQPVSQSYLPEHLVALYQAATGWTTTFQALMRAGERAWTVLKAANIREGFTAEEDRWPEVFFQPLARGKEKEILKDYQGKPLSREEVQALFREYYEERGWDKNTGLPTFQGLSELGLEAVAADLANRQLI